MVNSSIGIRAEDVINPLLPHITDYLNRKSGPLKIAGGCEALAFIDTKHQKKRDGLTDMELLFFVGVLKGDFILQTVLNLNARTRQMWDKYRRKYDWAMVLILLKPKSRGRVRLRANNVNVKHEIVPNYFEDAEDVKTMIAGIRASIDVSRTKAM